MLGTDNFSGHFYIVKTPLGKGLGLNGTMIAAPYVIGRYCIVLQLFYLQHIYQSCD